MSIGLFRLSIGLVKVLLVAGFIASLAPSFAAVPQIVINEVMYHPPNDEDSLQYIELFNRSEQSADISGWAFTKGVKFTFPAKTTIPPKGFLVLCRDLKAFQKQSGTNLFALGDFSGRLKHGSDKLELTDSNKKIVEAFKYQDSTPWPAGPDGHFASLERICPQSAADQPYNWSSSKWFPLKKSPGSPGRVNDSFSPHPLPIISDVKWSNARPGDDIPVSAIIQQTSGIQSAVLLFRTVQPGKESDDTEIPMRRVSGDEQAGLYEAAIPGQKDKTLIRFKIKAVSEKGTIRLAPAASEPRKAFSVYVHNPPSIAKTPIVAIINATKLARPISRYGPASPGPGNSALIYTSLEGKTEVFDFVEVRRRHGGWKVHFLKDQLLDNMSAINLIFEGNTRYLLSEPLAYELYRRAGVLTPQAGHARLNVDGKAVGYYLMVEQPNKNFLARNKRDDNGNLYKLLWYADNVVDKHEKKTNISTGHDDVTSLIENLENKQGDELWKFIQQQFNVDAMVSYYAVNMCLQNWDGFFNNYFVYHDLKPGGKWELIPWDEDKTWGDYDGAPRDYAWYSMPLTIGMTGDRAPFSLGGGRGPYGGPGWWRPAGYFSGPLLAQPEFRKKLMARIQELCNTVFTEEKFGPVITSMEQRLRPEVTLAAAAAGRDEESALRDFDAQIDSFRRQLVHRRNYLLKHVR